MEGWGSGSGAVPLRVGSLWADGEGQQGKGGGGGSVAKAELFALETLKCMADV